jgi:hypothetical protein
MRMTQITYSYNVEQCFPSNSKISGIEKMLNDICKYTFILFRKIRWRFGLDGDK